MKRYYGQIILYFVLFISNLAIAQNIDSLKQVVTTLSGKEKAQLCSDLCFYLCTNKPHEAIQYGHMAVQLATELKDSAFMASCENDLALGFYYKGDIDSCIYWAQQAYTYRLQHNMLRDAAASLSKVALGYYEQGNYSKSLECNLEAVRLFKLAKADKEASRLQNNIGSIYERNKQLQLAKEMYFQSAQTCLSLKDYSGYVSAQGNYAIALQKQDSTAKALELLKKLENIAVQYCDAGFLAQVYQEMGVAYRKLNNTSLGLNYYLKARQIYDSIESLSGLSIINVNIGNCYADLHKFNVSEEYLQKGLEQSVQLKSLLWQAKAYFGLYDVERLRGNFKKANEYLELYQQINDSLYSAETQDKLAELQTRYAVAEKENTILQQQSLIQEKEIKIERRNISLIALSLVVLLIFSVIIYIIQKNKIKQKQQLIDAGKQLQNERRRIAADLHDNLGAELTLISSALDIKSAKTADHTEKNALNEIADKCRAASSLMRDTIWTISNEKLLLSQLGFKLKDFAERQLKPVGIEVLYSMEGIDIELSPDVTLNLYRIGQEIITNAAKYSKATRFTINIYYVKSTTIELSDNGIGFDMDTIEKGYGLNNIFNRAKYISSLIKYNTYPEKGCNLKITL